MSWLERDSTDRMKPKGFEDYSTISEVAALVNRSVHRIKMLERQKILPAPIRVPFGKLKVRLYSPEQVAKIDAHFRTVRPGPRPK